jgi:hypothetical protein
VKVFERNLPLVKPNPQTNFQVNLLLCDSPEYKIQDVHLVAILILGGNVFERNLPLVDLNPSTNFR